MTCIILIYFLCYSYRRVYVLIDIYKKIKIVLLIYDNKIFKDIKKY